MLGLDQLPDLLPEQLRVGKAGDQGGFVLIGRMQLQMDLSILHHEAPDLLIFQQGDHLGIGNFVADPAKQGDEQPDHKDQNGHIHQKRKQIAFFQCSFFSLFSYTWGFRMPT